MLIACDFGTPQESTKDFSTPQNMLQRKTHLIKVTEDDIMKTRNTFEVNDEKIIAEALVILADWCCKQEHFVEQNISKQLLERLFVSSKGSLEEAKRRIDRLLTTRGMMKEITFRRTAEEFKHHCKLQAYIALPKMHSGDQSRIMVIHFPTHKLDELESLAFHRFSVLLTEYRQTFDYALAERYIFDMTNFSFSLITKMSPILLKKTEILCSKGFSTKIKGVHILNAPSYVDKVVFILKQAFRQKVAQRIYVHDSNEDLHKHIPKEILPVDYGGDEPALAKLHERWVDELQSKEMAEYFITSDRLMTDETRRSPDKFNEEYMGMPGSFRKLNVD